jgi:hypothetical protein
MYNEGWSVIAAGVKERPERGEGWRNQAAREIEYESLIEAMVAATGARETRWPEKLGG